jgi:transcription antitermination protein NusB
MSDAPKLPSPRHLARELVVQGLYQHMVTGDEASVVRVQLESAEIFRQADSRFFREYWVGVFNYLEAAQAHLAPHLDRPLTEVSPCERAILCMGAYELGDRLDIPYRVVINESIELAKSFGGTDGHKYVNGVLDKLAPLLREAEVTEHKQRPRR